MAEAGTRARPAPLASALLGVVFVLVGAAALGGLIYIGNSRAPSAEHALISIGLAGSVLVSAIAQGLVVIGLWLLWRTLRRRAD